MFTIQKIKDNFYLSKTFSFNENKGSYTETLTEEFSDFGGFCDIYIEEFNNEILQNQVDVFNNFLQNFKNYLPQINTVLNKKTDIFYAHIDRL